ncbi:target of Nesh-SH3 isoform X4 [Peromyscus californicus insignis]|uniref:target of Nesh-SH3 isoform X4 n=1 Tax=Peromyscus californicus insignis TaxID=564181 RepID=UPI0022A70C10|nr:target of Nesh-SH3 isoform X4 [Peromyscus californicus insignis]
MLSSLGCLLLCGSIALALGNAQKLPKGKRPNLKVHINTTSDSILLKFLRPNPNVKLEGFLLGYGSNVSPNQYFPLPTEGKVTEAVVDAEPKYLIVVRPAPPPSQKKSCSGKSRSRKPLQLVVGTLSPSSVFLSWGFLINPHHDWTLPSHCPNDRFYTIRYREKDKEKKWIFQLCPATETIVDNLKPNTVYEFGVKDNMDGGIWSKVFNHKTVVGSKNKVNGKIQSTYDQVHTVPAYVPRKLIPITIIKQVIQNVTHRASTKAPDKTPFGGTILVHLIIPGLNDSMVKLPTSIMLEISDALKAQLAKNETLALPAESKTPEAEKVAPQLVTVTPETVSRSIKPTASSALDTSEPALALNEKTPETARSVLMPEFELPLSTLAPKRFPEFPEAEAAFPLEKPGGTLVSREEQWVVPGVKTSGDSKFVQPPTATHDVISSSTTSDETEIEPRTATSDPILDSVPPKTSRTPEQPRATLAPSEASFDPHKVEIFTSPEAQPTTAAPQQTTSIPTTPKRRFRPKPPPIIKPAPEPETLPSSQSTKAQEPATVPLVPTIVPKLSQRPKATRRPEVPQIQPDLKPPKQLLPKPKATPDMPPTKFAYEQPATLGTEAPALAIVTTTDIEPVIMRTKAPVTTLAPKTPRPRTRRPRPPIHKATPRPKIPQPKPADLGPITPEPSLASTTTKKARRPRPKPKTTPHPEVPQTILVPATTLEPVTRTEAPGMTLAPKLPQQPSHPHPKPKTTRSPAAPQTELVSTPVFEPVTPLKEDPVATIVPITDLEPVTDLETPVTFRTEAPGTTLASKMSQRTRRPRPRPKATMSPQAPQTKPAPEPVTARPEAPVTLELEPVTLRTETWVTTKAPKTSKWPRRPHLKPKTTQAPEAPLTKPVAATGLEPSALRTEVPATVVLATALEPVSLRTKAPETTTLASKVQRTRRPRPRPKTTASTDMSESKSAPTELQTLVLKPVTSPSLEMTQSQSVSDDRELVAFSTESPQKTIAPAETDYVDTTIKEPLRPEEPRTEVVDSLTHVSELPETMLETAPLPSQTIVLPRPEEPQTEPAPRQTPGTPPKLKTTPHPRIPPQPPVPKGSQHTTSKPKMPPSPQGADTTSVPKDEQLSHETDPEVSHTETVLPPVTFRAEPLKTTIAPLETRNIPFIPVISPRPSQEELQTALEETDRSTQELSTTKIPRRTTTEWAKTTQAPHRLYTTPVRPRIPDRPHARPVLNKTTTRPGKTKPKGNGVGTGTKQAPKPPSTGRNVSVDPHATKKPGTIPGTRRPPMPPRPISPQRKPLPPNNVTGKPGSAGIISSSRVTSPPLKATLKPTGTAAERPEAEKKHPTTPASEEEIGNTTDFSSSPTKETDHLGKPRFTGPHVRYIPKPDNRPCSITDSVRRFPTEEATEGNATSPPQNPPTNLTVVTVEGCPSFVILDWEKPLNDTVTEYEVISRENGSFSGKNKSIQITNQTFSTVENLKPDTSYEFQVKPKNPLGEGPASNTVAFSTESADPRVSEPISAGRDAIWTERPFNSDSYSECKGKQYVKRTWYKKFVGVQLCNSLRYKIYLSDSLTGKFYNIGDQRGHGEDHCQFVDSFLDGRTGQQLASDQLPTKEGYFRAVRQEPVQFGEIGGHTQINYVQWYECGTTIPGKW